MTAMTDLVEHSLDFEFTKDIPYLIIIGKLCENFVENWLL